MSTKLLGVRVEDEGFFVCSAFSVAGSIATKAYLEVTAMADEPPPIIKVNLIKCCQFSGQLFYIFPLYQVGPANQTLPINTLAVLPCEASGEF